MFRLPRAVGVSKLRAVAAGSSLRCAAGTAELAPVIKDVPAPKFTEVKFKKEQVDDVMLELPEFNFYEMKEPVPNPYKGVTMDRTILIDPPKPEPVTAPKVEFAKLENGMKIATIDRKGLTSHIGLYVHTGSRYEKASNFGVSHMISKMAFKSTAHLSHLRTVKTLEQLGASLSTTCTAGREEIAYQVSVMREFVPLVVPLVIGNVLFPRLLPWEVKAEHKQVEIAKKALEANPDAMVNELLHKAAYCNNTLGISPIATERSKAHFTPDTIRSFMMDHFAPERMVLVGVNVSQEELSKWAMRSFVDYNAIPLKKREEVKASYTGGSIFLDGSSPYCHLAVGLESVGWGSPDLPAVTLLQTLLGGGSTVSTAPGSGATSRLSKQILKQSPYVESCSAFSTTYTDSGIFGLYGVSQPAQAGDMAMAMVKSITGLGSISADELSSAKGMLKGKLLRQVDDNFTLMQDIGTQVLLSGRYATVQDFAKAIDAVSADQVAAAAKKLLSSKPTVVAYGDTHAVPHYSKIEAALASKA
mmetsp:Transcript_61749/g.147317  ORF Transcript_61749/g.147317 Transcript_61749/m.147317 type:complete len:530 (-) Transcript_61749:126-1715(-)